MLQASGSVKSCTVDRIEKQKVLISLHSKSLLGCSCRSFDDTEHMHVLQSIMCMWHKHYQPGLLSQPLVECKSRQCACKACPAAVYSAHLGATGRMASATCARVLDWGHQ